MRRRLALTRGLIALGLLLLAGLAVTLFKPAEGTPTDRSARVGAPAPQIALSTPDGGRSDLRADRGKVVLINFWATWCEPCKTEMPALQSLADGLNGQPFVLYSVDLQEDAQEVLAFEAQYNLRLYALLDENGDSTRTYNVRALPASFLVDKQGVLREQRLGPLVTGEAQTAWSEAWLADRIRALLAG